MKRLFVSAWILVLLLAACSTPPAQEAPEAEKEEKQKLYAKWANRVYKDKEMKEIAAVLAKGESVIKLGEEEIPASPDGKKEAETVYRIQLADGLEAYARSDLFALKTIVFTEESTDCFVRPTLDSRRYYVIPKGTLAFITEEGQDGWVKVWIGKVEDDGKEKWVTDQWVKGGYSEEIALIRDARLYEEALETLKSNEEEGFKALKELQEESTTFFAGLAARILGEQDPFSEEGASSGYSE